jgi:hypothetical protein
MMDAHQRVPGERLQPFEGKRQMCAALVARDCVNFVHDHRAAGGKHVAAGLRAEQDIKRFGRGHHDVRGLAPHACPLGLRRVAGPHHGANLHIRQAKRREFFPDSRERCLEIALNVVG